MRHAANVPYRDGTFTGLVRDGRPWEGVVENVDIIYKKFSGAVTEGALARPGGSRLQRDASVTPFQKLLSVRQSDFQRGVPGAPMGPNDETLRRKVLGQACTFTELDARQKHDVNNDPQRRFFDTVFARKLLVNTLSRHEDALRDYSDSLLTFYRDDLLAASREDWESACQGRYQGDDGRLQQLNIQVGRARQALDALPQLSKAQRELGMDLYGRRYLNYLVDETQAYKDDHPRGIIKSKSNPLYFKRGRLDGEFAERASLSMGILRNVDPCPVDLRFDDHPEPQKGVPAGLYTRCPDRLHMADPDSAIDSDPDSWLSYNFLSGVTPYVNGLSGSILVEIGGLVYARSRMLQADEGTYSALDAPQETVEAYFRALAAMYSYIDGGHSLYEIQSSFRQTWVAPSLVKIFKDEKWAGLGQDLYGDPEIFRQAWTETRQFAQVLEGRRAVHAELRAPLAFRQSSAARGLMHAPGFALQEELAHAARALAVVLQDMDAPSRIELCRHLTADQRLLSGQSVGALQAALGRVSGIAEEAGAIDRAVVVALLGDIGGMLTTPANASGHLHGQLTAALNASGLQVPDVARIALLKSAGGSATVGPRKRAERSVLAISEGQSRPLRAGVQNTGGGADVALGIPAFQRLPANSWVEFDIDAARQQGMQEPMVGHMSASPAEILQAWDMLRGVPSDRQFVAARVDDRALGDDQTRERMARAAGSTAFLLGLGYHSAVEVLEGTLAYTGQSLRGAAAVLAPDQDAGHLFGEGAATELIVELLDSHLMAE